jgi:hypothetical protein
MVLAFIWVAACVMHACRSANVKAPTQPVAQQKPEQLNLERAAGAESRIVFLTMNISVEDSVKETYRLKKVEVITAGGTTKKQQADEAGIEPGFLYCEILDADNKRTDIIRVQNPLLKVYEFTAEGSNALEKKAFKSNSGEFVLRFNLNRSARFLAVYKMKTASRELKKIYYAQL